MAGFTGLSPDLHPHQPGMSPCRDLLRPLAHVHETNTESRDPVKARGSQKESPPRGLNLISRSSSQPCCSLTSLLREVRRAAHAAEGLASARVHASTRA